MTIHFRRCEMGACRHFEKVQGRGAVVVVNVVGIVKVVGIVACNIVVVVVVMINYVRVNRSATMEESTNAISECSSTTHIHCLLLNLRHSNPPFLLSLSSLLFFPSEIIIDSFLSSEPECCGELEFFEFLWHKM